MYIQKEVSNMEMLPIKNGEIVMLLDCQSILWNILEFIQKIK